MKPPYPYVGFKLFLLTAVVVPSGLRQFHKLKSHSAVFVVGPAGSGIFLKLLRPHVRRRIPTELSGKGPPLPFKVQLAKTVSHRYLHKRGSAKRVSQSADIVPSKTPSFFRVCGGVQSR